MSIQAVLVELRASQIPSNVPLEAQVEEAEVEVEAAELPLRLLLLLQSQLCYQEPLLRLPAVV
jgi:hypothetical protein